jgi:tRNA wybutosine-synthesizing protein 2
MKPFKEALTRALEGKIDERLSGFLPSGFQVVGDIAILNLRKELLDKGGIIGRSMLVIYPSIKTVCIKLDGVKGIERAPSIEKVAGDGTETIHRENNCLYKLDVTKVMFSKGNTLERGRLAGIVKKDETVADMFAGIGYFSIPVAKAGAKKVYALEINPAAFGYLEQNIKLNNLGNVEAFNCDNRKPPEKLHGVADRVLMGYLSGRGGATEFRKNSVRPDSMRIGGGSSLSGTDKFLDAAVWFLKPAGGVIHFHDVYRDSDLWGRPVSILSAYAKKHGMKMSVLEKHIVKQYAPRMQHVVVDAEFKPERKEDL